MSNEPQIKKEKKPFAVSKLVTWTLGSLVLVLCLFLIFRKPKTENPVGSILIEIKALPNNINFLTDADIHQRVDTILEMKNFSKAYCEMVLEKNPYIKRAEIFQDLSGKLKCIITQRQPIVRVINQYQKHYYIDKTGFKFAAQTGTSARVVVVNGNIQEGVNPQDTLKTQIGQDIYAIASFVEQEVFWKQFTEQLYVDKNKDIHLIPKVGSFTIVMGNANNLKEKFENLKIFVTTILPKVGWDKYRTINVKYSNQIVTEKN